MNGNKRERRVRRQAAPSYSYAQVEGALAALYDAQDVVQSTFRARLKHLKKLGLPAQQPGKGSRIRYAESDIFQMLLACEFSEYGIDPHLIADILRRHWRLKGNLWQAIDLAQQFPGDDFHVAVEAYFMSFTWNRETTKHSATEISVRVPPAEPVRIQIFKASDMPKLLEALKHGRRYCVFNLSARIRALKEALMSGEEPNGSA